MAMPVAVLNSSRVVQPLTCRLSAPLGSGFSPVCQSLRVPANPTIIIVVVVVIIIIIVIIIIR